MDNFLQYELVINVHQLSESYYTPIYSILLLFHLRFTWNTFAIKICHFVTNIKGNTQNAAVYIGHNAKAN
jgi:hypothetical protein